MSQESHQTMNTEKQYTYLLIAPVAWNTGKLLQDYLADRGVVTHTFLPGVLSTHDAVVCYGYGGPSSLERSLNGRCGTSKIERLKSMYARGVKTVPWFSKDEGAYGKITYPLLARKTNGHGGEDIVPVFQAEEVGWRRQAGWTWFSSYIPVESEYRIWVFRDAVFGGYEKVMKRPEDYKYIGRNYRNGFEFAHCAVDGNLVQLALSAVKACNLDFAAVDILVGKDGARYVLEVNTAPGVIRSGAQKTLGMLADYIVKWLQEGCQTRG